MIKTLRNLFKQDKEKFIVPKSVQAVIPLKKMCIRDRIIRVSKAPTRKVKVAPCRCNEER